jgi:hypothetical protein
VIEPLTQYSLLVILIHFIRFSISFAAYFFFELLEFFLCLLQAFCRKIIAARPFRLARLIILC